MNENIIKKVCKELGITPQELEKRYPYLQNVLKEYEEFKIFEKVLQKVVGVDRVEQKVKFSLR